MDHAAHHRPFRRAEQTTQAGDADPCLPKSKLLDAFGHGLSPGSPRGADVGDPVLGDAPPFHLVAAPNKGGKLAGFWKDDSDRGLVAADMREITNVSLKLIPVALVGQA